MLIMRCGRGSGLDNVNIKVRRVPAQNIILMGNVYVRISPEFVFW